MSDLPAGIRVGSGVDQDNAPVVSLSLPVPCRSELTARVTVHVVLTLPDARRVALRLLDEIARAERADGISIAEGGAR